LALDIHTQQKTTKRGIYALPEDDKHAQNMNTELPSIPSLRARSQGYAVPTEQTPVITGSGPTWQLPEEDIAYHNRYGAEEEAHGPVESDGSHNRLIDH
jgi:hypothetical protein